VDIFTGFAVNRHTGPVAHALFGARQGIEQSRFSAIGISNDPDNIITH
jgi:hypothetical protein